MSSVTIVTFYKVTPIENVSKLKREVERLAFKENLSGTFFATSQGINTTLAGNQKGLERLINLLTDSFLIKGIDPTWTGAFKTPFKRLKIRIKDKLLPLKGNFNIFDLRGRHVDPEHWNKLLEDPEFIVLDVRNEYETRIGTFKNSLIPSTKHFTDLPEYIHNNKKIFKNKKIAMFCTGGIRCEIASSFTCSCNEPNPLWSTIARCNTSAISVSLSGSSWNRVDRLINELFTEYAGFSVVAPMRMTIPCSTASSNTSCWLRLNR